MAKKFFIVHGRSWKPAQESLQNLWFDAIKYGLKEDYGDDAVTAFDGAKPEMVYYGNHTNDFLSNHPRGGSYDETGDVNDRKLCLADLKAISPRSEFYNRTRYKQIPGRRTDMLLEGIADTLAPVFSLFNMGDNIIGKILPDMAEYWNADTAYGSAVRWELTAELAKALDNGDDVMLVTHSLGTMIGYDVLWKFSWYGEYQHLRDKKLSHFVTLGTPLTNPVVQNEMKGSSAKGARRYPSNVARWTNLSAEDDPICHDETAEDDFKGMTDHHNTAIEDVQIYNMAQRYREKHPPNGECHPHQSSGYLIHPEFTKVLKAWLDS